MNIRVAITEDNDSIRKSLALILDGSPGLRCCGAWRTAEDALANLPPAQILAAVEEVHRGGSPMSSQIARMLVQQFQQAGRGQDELSRLTPREEEVLGLAVKGYRSKEIGDALSHSAQNVQTHFRNLYEKLQVGSRAEAVARYLGR